MKSKIFRNNDAEYQKFYAGRADIIHTGNHIVGIDEYDILPFKEFTTGCVYVAEVKVSGNDIVKMVVKEAISKAENFAGVQDVLIEVLGSRDYLDGYFSDWAEAESVIHEVAPNAECVFSIHVDDTLGDTAQVTVAAKIPA